LLFLLLLVLLLRLSVIGIVHSMLWRGRSERRMREIAQSSLTRAHVPSPPGSGLAAHETVSDP
jgi:hypothetical protein